MQRILWIEARAALGVLDYEGVALNMEAFQACLGIDAFGLCKYDPLNPANSYFSIGEAVSTFALLIAVSQLAGPELKFRLRISRTKVHVALGCFVFAIFCASVAAVLPSILGYLVPVVGFPIFWELLGLLSVVLGGSVIAHLYLKPTSFSESNFESYFRACMAFISQGDPVSLRALADELEASIDPIVSACKRFNSWEAKKADEEGRTYDVAPDTGHALECLNLLADERFCRVVVEYSPRTAVLLITKVLEATLHEQWGRALIHQLIRQALINPNSIMHREDDYSGLGRFKSFTKSVFGRYEFINSLQRPLQAWRHYDDGENTLEILKKYALALETAFGSYFEGGDYWTHPAALWVGVKTLVDSSQFKLLRLRLQDGEWLGDTDAHKSWSVVGDTLKKLLRLVTESDGKLPTYDFDTSTYDKFRDPSIYGVIADGIYEYLEKLSMYRKDDESIRLLAIDLWLEIAPISAPPFPRAVVEIQKRLAVHLTKKVTQNLSEGYYPALTRILISLMGLHDGPAGRPPEFFVREFHLLLRRYFAEAYRTDSEKAKDMLPKGVTFDEGTKQLIVEKRWKGGVPIRFGLSVTSAEVVPMGDAKEELQVQEATNGMTQEIR